MIPSTAVFLFVLGAVSPSFAASSTTGSRKFTVTNNCNQTIWPALFTTPGAASPGSNVSTGWEAKPGSSKTFSVADGWGGRIWGRTGAGVPPATLADWYDVSQVDGFNLPMKLTNTGNGTTASCPTDENPGCPDSRMEVLNSNGDVVGCKSSCYANLDGTPTDSANCCTGSHDTAATCPKSGVEYYSYFKDHCKYAYAYAYDESSQSALFTTPSSDSTDYTLTFCP
ncbi:hypothetical protein MNV49_006613 [Pseudohyphozyma bogoriensis]|nr:hypothetical protein MNV49_006613 [Pseudohyphozyma bogoriensis]